MGMPDDQTWIDSREEIKHFSKVTSLGHVVAKLDNMTHKTTENLRTYIYQYTTMHYATTNKFINRILILERYSDSWLPLLTQ